MAIELPKKTARDLTDSIKRYFFENLDEEIGDLKASLFLDFCLKEIGPTIYNRAVADVQFHLQDRISELDGSCYEPEFAYWKKR